MKVVERSRRILFLGPVLCVGLLTSCSCLPEPAPLTPSSFSAELSTGNGDGTVAQGRATFNLGGETLSIMGAVDNLDTAIDTAYLRRGDVWAALQEDAPVVVEYPVETEVTGGDCLFGDCKVDLGRTVTLDKAGLEALVAGELYLDAGARGAILAEGMSAPVGGSLEITTTGLPAAPEDSGIRLYGGDLYGKEIDGAGTVSELYYGEYEAEAGDILIDQITYVPTVTYRPTTTGESVTVAQGVTSTIIISYTAEPASVSNSGQPTPDLSR